MKHALKIVVCTISLLALTACCGCMPPKKTAMAHQAMACSTAKVSGMTCEACAATVTANLKKIKGVTDVSVDVAKGTVTVYTAPKAKLSTAEVKKVVEFSGYKLVSVQHGCAQ